MRHRAFRRDRQAVITGLGIVSPIGVGVDRFWSAALAGVSGTGHPTLFDASKLPRECQVVGEVKSFDVREWMPGAPGQMAARFSQFAVAASKMAHLDSKLASANLHSERIKVAIGTSAHGLSDVHEPNYAAFKAGESVVPWMCLEDPAHSATSHVAIANSARGQTATLATACSAGLDAVAWAADQVSSGQATAVIAGGTEAPLSSFISKSFHAVGVLSKWPGPPEEASRPFDFSRSGMVLAEGAAVVVVEAEDDARARGATIYARIAGSASTTEGAHLRKVDESGETVTRAILSALDKSELSVRDIDYVSAHGNSMQDYDVAETAGIKRALGKHAFNIPVSSLKSMCGQALAASSAMQVISSCLSMRDQIVHPTINYQTRDPKCDLDYVPNTPRIARVRTALIHAHSLGGSHIAMILTVPD